MKYTDTIATWTPKDREAGEPSERETNDEKATFREMTEEDQKWLLLSVFKRVRDMDYAKYQRWLQEAQKPPAWLP